MFTPACRVTRTLLRYCASTFYRAPTQTIQHRGFYHSNLIRSKRIRASWTSPILVSGFAFISASIWLVSSNHASFDSQISSSSQQDQAPHLPRYRLSDVKKHDSQSDNPWIIYQNKVYDITEWVPAHPGGQVILRAAGGSIDPYWEIFTIHKADYVYDILAQYLIGYLDEADLVDGKPAQERIEDPFADDPERHPALITRTAKPRNAETPASALEADFLTPNDLFYVRNHMWVPKIDDDPTKRFLTVELVDGTVKKYSLQELKDKFPSRQVTAAMQCSGNRRKDMNEGSGRPTNGLPWSIGAISNATWEGVVLADVLADAGFDVKHGMSGNCEAKHVQFLGSEAYGASIPLKKAIDPQGDVILAYAMNGKPLPRDHGFPLRAIVPGHVAARSVKWLSSITLSEEESTSQWQRRDYKCFGPNETKVDWEAAPAIQELPVQSAITHVRLGDWIEKNTDIVDGEKGSSNASITTLSRKISLSGYAFSGGGRAIVRVDVSLNGGRTWSQASLVQDCVPSKNGTASPCMGYSSWAWKRWRYNGSIPIHEFHETSTAAMTTGGQGSDKSKVASKSGKAAKSGDKRCTTVIVKATDEAYNTQPESHTATWNIRGNLATAWHRVQVCTDCTSSVMAKPKKVKGQE